MSDMLAEIAADKRGGRRRKAASPGRVREDGGRRAAVRLRRGLEAAIAPAATG